MLVVGFMPMARSSRRRAIDEERVETQSGSPDRVAVPGVRRVAVSQGGPRVPAAYLP